MSYKLFIDIPEGYRDFIPIIEHIGFLKDIDNIQLYAERQIPPIYRNAIRVLAIADYDHIDHCGQVCTYCPNSYCSAKKVRHISIEELFMLNTLKGV